MEPVALGGSGPVRTVPLGRLDLSLAVARSLDSRGWMVRLVHPPPDLQVLQEAMTTARSRPGPGIAVAFRAAARASAPTQSPVNPTRTITSPETPEGRPASPPPAPPRTPATRLPPASGHALRFGSRRSVPRRTKPAR